MTFLDKIELSFADTKAWLLKEFGEHIHIHNAMSDLKMQVLSHVSDHFGETTPSNKSEQDNPNPEQ